MPVPSAAAKTIPGVLVGRVKMTLAIRRPDRPRVGSRICRQPAQRCAHDIMRPHIGVGAECEPAAVV